MLMMIIEIIRVIEMVMMMSYHQNVVAYTKLVINEF